MKRFNILMVTSATLLLSSGCVKPAPETTQPIYNPTTPATQTVATQATSGIYEEAQSDIYVPGGTTANATDIYNGTQVDQTVITTPAVSQTVYSNGGTSYPDPYATASQTTTSATSYPDPYANGSQSTTSATSYPDPYATASQTTSSATSYPDPYATASQTTSSTTSYPDPYATNSQPISNYPVSTPSYPATSSSHGGGIQLQIAALKDYSTAEDYKNRLSLAPGQSAYIKRGLMNKVIIKGISSVAEANRLKERRFPGAFIVQGGSSSGSYTPPIQPNHTTTYSVNNPYGVSSSSHTSSGNSGVGVQVGAFASRGKAQSVADSKGGQHPAIVKKIGQYYKVILTGFSSRSSARAYASRVNGFVVNY